MTTKPSTQDFQPFQTSEEPIKPFAFNITEVFFASVLIDRSAVQDALTSLETDESDFLKKFHSLHSDKLKNTDRFMEDKKEAEKLRQFLEDTKSNLKNATIPEVISEYESNLSDYESKLKKVQERLDRRDSTKVFNGHVSSQINDVVARGLENLAVQLGEWFATGAVGPGTVTYRGRKFIAE